MPLAPPIYRKVPEYPIYYKVDFAHQCIESIKDWRDKPKSIDRYDFFPEFAENISDLYKPISQANYLIIKGYVELQTNKAGNSAVYFIPPPYAAKK